MAYLGQEFEHPPKTQCAGLWVPIEILELQEEGIINPKEMLILSWIDNLSKQEDKSGVFKGCFAGNQWFAKKVRVEDVTTVSKMISHLKELGLVIEKGFDGRKRYLWSVWSLSLLPSRSRQKRQGRAG